MWLWGFGRTLPFGAELLPQTAGLDAYGGITLTAIYAAARVCRRIKIDERMKTRWLMADLPILLTATAIGFGNYNSPFAFALAAVYFLLFKRLRISSKLGTFVVWLAPSMFSVYLIHTNDVGVRFILGIQDFCFGYFTNKMICIVLCGILVFICALVLDAPRRLCVHILKKGEM